jgi:putative Holliday junction resolvase
MADADIGPRRRQGRTLGLDVGDRRIGVAISDPEQRLAVPVKTVERDPRHGEFEALAGLVREDEVASIVVGLPLSLSGEEGPQAARTRQFAAELESRLRLPVVFWDERLSTQEALRLRTPAVKPGRRDRARPGRVDTDAMAAAIILQAYLDSLGAGISREP